MIIDHCLILDLQNRLLKAEVLGIKNEYYVCMFVLYVIMVFTVDL